MNLKLDHNEIMMKPKVNNISLSSGWYTSIITISLKDTVLRMITNKSMVNKDNILLDPDSLLSSPPQSLYYDNINTGTWFKDAKHDKLTLPNQIPMLFCHFIDALSVDKYGKLTIETASTCFL